MRKNNNKKVWLTAGLAASFALFGAGLATVDTVDTSANNTITAESVGLVMDKGAGVRLGATDGNNGIRFVLTMDKTEYDSLMKKVGTEENPFTLDSKEPTASYQEFLLGETRYTSLKKAMPAVAEKLFEDAEAENKARYESYKRLANK